MPNSSGSTPTSLGESLNDASVDVGCGRRLEEHRVGEHRGEQDAGHRTRDLDAELLVAGGHDRRGRAHRQVQEENRAGRLDVAHTMVVHDLDDGRVLDAGGRLCRLVVVDEHDSTAGAPGHVGAREDADDLLGVVDDDGLAVRARR